ncbi:VOC family protein [Phaeacidiphilus oryzae]|uniref:VOC family protein n=1 Tax=Phaeacidiphilus oryzae TaxID=348818 RepID=UPI00055ED57D|nr:VOC family protein [Phaeacidiphilus oryzae]
MSASSSGLAHVLYPVRDAEKAKAVFTDLLGAEPTIDEPYYIHYQVGSAAVGLVPNGHEQQNMSGPVPYFTVPDVKAAVESLKAAGAETLVEPRDVGGGKLVATVKDSDGNPIGLTS